MSSDAFLTFDKGEEIALADWEKFAEANGLMYDPHVMGHNVYRRQADRIEVQFGDDTETIRRGDGSIDFAACRPPGEAGRITISTYFMDESCPAVAVLAVAAWREFGGGLDASPEIREHIGATISQTLDGAKAQRVLCGRHPAGPP